METLQKLFAFMRKNGIKKASWDNKLTFYMSDNKPPQDADEFFERFADALQEPSDLDEKMRDQFGDRHDRPLWFHV